MYTLDSLQTIGFSDAVAVIVMTTTLIFCLYENLRPINFGARQKELFTDLVFTIML